MAPRASLVGSGAPPGEGGKRGECAGGAAESSLLLRRLLADEEAFLPEEPPRSAVEGGERSAEDAGDGGDALLGIHAGTDWRVVLQRRARPAATAGLLG